MTDRDDLDQLLNSLIGFAQEQLIKQDGFLPYFGTLGSESAGGEQVQFGMVHLEDEFPSASEVRETTFRGLKTKAQEGTIRACAVVTDMRIKEGAPGFEDSIHVLLEHSSGRVVEFNLPYRKNGDVYDYGDVLFDPGQPEIFSN